MSGYLREILIGARQTGRTKQQISEMLDILEKTYKPVALITKSGYIILKTKEEIINYFLKGIKPNEK